MSPPSAARRLFILVVETDDSAAQRLAMRLRACGHEVFTARSEEQAVRGLLVHPCEVVLIDAGLGGDVSGVAERLCVPMRKRPLLVAMTARDDDGSCPTPGGFDHGVAKPVDASALV